jgi:hypothetical protein
MGLLLSRVSHPTWRDQQTNKKWINIFFNWELNFLRCSYLHSSLEGCLISRNTFVRHQIFMHWDKYEQDLSCKSSENDGCAEFFHTVYVPTIVTFMSNVIFRLQSINRELVTVITREGRMLSSY